MIKNLFFTSIFSSTLLSQIPFPDGKPTFNNLPPFTSPSWDKNGNVASGIYSFNLDYFSFVSVGPSAKNYTPIPGYQRAQISINPPEFVQNSTNINCNLNFWYRFSANGITSAKILINNIFYCYIPESAGWTRFSTNLNIGSISKLTFEVANNQSIPKSPSLFIDAVQYNPIWSFPQNNNTNFVISTENNFVKWNSSVYPGGLGGFKLYSTTNLNNNFSLVTNIPTLTSSWYYVSLPNVTNNFYQLRSN